MRGFLQQDGNSSRRVVTTGQLRNARRVFDMVHGAPAELRQAILDSECGREGVQRELVESLFLADHIAGPSLGIPLDIGKLVTQNDFPEAGLTFGSYRILRELGAGGMGTVYLASRVADGNEQLYALKVLKWFSWDVLQRFDRERVILARLLHPNIARLFETGSAPGGTPYFVMEYVEGLPIQQYCSKNALSVQARLGLFRQICLAVGYLHQNLVIHRDIKPSNVLVTDGGVVKLVDFGIAKLLQPDGVMAAPGFTNTGLMTPDYASPEQVRGGPTTTLTDVYSLGALLYELLTEIKPFNAQEVELHDLLRRICEDEADRPSVAVSSQKQWDAAKRRSLSRQLSGELDNIILTSMQKDPSRRYASVEQLDADVERYLIGMPVRAQGDSPAYRAKKFFLRNRTSVLAALAIFLSLVIGITTAGIEARNADRARTAAEQNAREADRQRTMAIQERRAADQQRAEANRQRIRAEQQAAATLAERTKAVRRLQAFQRLGHRVLDLYAASANVSQVKDIYPFIADDARAFLAGMQQEGALSAHLTGLFDEISTVAHSLQLAADSTWHVPYGWEASETKPHEYLVGVDRRSFRNKDSSLFVHSLVAEPTGSVEVAQILKAAAYRNKRVRLSGFLKTTQVKAGAAGLGCDCGGLSEEAFPRIDLSGASAWKGFTLVMDIPADAQSVKFWLRMSGSGTLWAARFNFETVDLSVPVTSRSEPQNMDFAIQH
jgi:serine/threonine protein kinase